jgi:pimeloyl-ACP methyl ester carboxylesterase
MGLHIDTNQGIRKPRKQRVVPMHFRMTGKLLNGAARVNSDWVAERVARLWFTVFKTRPRPWVHSFWQGADKCVSVHLQDKCHPVYIWGEGPLVVLLHGWSGSGTQYRYFIPSLVEAGFSVATFDAPAHGAHPGRQAHLLDFSDTLVGIEQALGPVHAVVAHSLGNMAATLATHRGLQTRRMVMLAPHLDAATMFKSYTGMLGLQPGLHLGLRDRVGDEMSRILQVDDAWKLLNTRSLLMGQGIEGLLIYDQDDQEVPREHFDEIESVWGPDQVLRTEGLGHFRLFKDQALIERVTEYLKTGL